MTQLEFYCRDCESTFRSAPDGSGYDQAPCPACREVCMTVQFEAEEQQRHHNEATLFSYLGQLTGTFSLNVPDAPDRKPPDDDPPQQLPPLSDQTSLCSCQSTSEATEYCAILDEAGIRSLIVEHEAPAAAGPVDLQVAAADVRRASEILKEYRATKNQNRRTEILDGQILFCCEQCNGVLGFPIDRRGGVESCSHCGEFVDVPD